MKVVAQVFQWVVTLASKSNLRIGGSFRLGQFETPTRVLEPRKTLLKREYQKEGLGPAQFSPRSVKTDKS